MNGPPRQQAAPQPGAAPQPPAPPQVVGNVAQGRKRLRELLFELETPRQKERWRKMRQLETPKQRELRLDVLSVLGGIGFGAVVLPVKALLKVRELLHKVPYYNKFWEDIFGKPKVEEAFKQGLAAWGYGKGQPPR